MLFVVNGFLIHNAMQYYIQQVFLASLVFVDTAWNVLIEYA
jgi:hypothetical protein